MTTEIKAGAITVSATGKPKWVEDDPEPARRELKAMRSDLDESKVYVSIEDWSDNENLILGAWVNVDDAEQYAKHILKACAKIKKGQGK